MKVVFITFLILNTNAIAADFKLPLAAKHLELPTEIEAKTLVPTAVESSRFYTEIKKDCSDFYSQIQKMNDNNIQISSADYQEIIKMPLALTMKPDYQLSLKINFELKTKNSFINLRFFPNNIGFNFSKRSVAFQRCQKKCNEDLNIDLKSDAVILTFRSRDLFCDYQNGDLHIFSDSDLYLKIEDNVHRSIVDKMTKIAENLADSKKFSDRSEMQAVIFGYQAAQNNHTNLKDYLSDIFDELLEPMSMHPKKYWSSAQADFYQVNYPTEHILKDKQLNLKRAVYE